MAFINIYNGNSQNNTIPEKASVTTGNKFTNIFASFIVIFSAGIIISLIWLAYLYVKTDPNDKSFDRIKDLLNILLPVIGTWMGTLLAFYFSKDNFAAASQQAKDLADRIGGVDQNLQQLQVKDVMIKTENAKLLTFADLPAFKNKKLSEILDNMQKTQSERLLVLKEGTMEFLFMLYRTTIERFLLGLSSDIKVNGASVAPDKIKDMTIGDMYNSDYQTFKDILKLVPTFVAIDATLDKAKEAMKDNSICQDVYVTQTGKINEKVLGWITNGLVIEKAGLFTKAGNKG